MTAVSVVGFFLRASCLYVLFILPWPGVRSGYAAVLCEWGRLVCQLVSPSSGVTWQLAENGPYHDVMVSVPVDHDAFVWEMTLNSRYEGYLPAAVFASLILATRAAWRRRFGALALGLVLLHVLVILVVAVLTVAGLGREGILHGPLVDAAMLAQNVHRSLYFYILFLVPLVIWLVLKPGPDGRSCLAFWLYRRVPRDRGDATGPALESVVLPRRR